MIVLFSSITYYVIQMTHSSYQNLWAVVTDKQLHVLYWLHKVCLVLADPLTTHFPCHIIDGDQNAMSLFKIIRKNFVTYPSNNNHFLFSLSSFFFIHNFNNILYLN